MMRWNQKMHCNITPYFQGKKNGMSLTRMSYEGKRLFIDGKQVKCSVQGNSLYWREGGRVGSLSFVNNSRLMRGAIAEGQKVYTFKACADYTVPLEVSDGRHYRLVFGSREEDGDVISYIVLREKDKETNLGYGSSYEKKDGNSYYTHIRMSVLPMTDECLGFGFLDMAYDDSYIHLNGFAWRDEESVEETPLFTVSGSLEFQHCLEREEPENADISQICTESQRRLLDGKNKELCVEELFTLPMPVVEDVNNSYPNAIYDLMRYAVTDEQRKYLGIEKPDFTQEEKSEAEELLKDEDIKKFLTENYYYATLSQALAKDKNNPYSDLITDIEKYDKRLQGYFSGSLSTSMNADIGYQKLNQRLYPQLYFRSSPVLKGYLDKKEEWAQKLHTYVLYNENAFSMVDEYAHNTQSNMHNMTVLLDYFDCSKRLKMKNKMKFSYMNAEAVDYYISYGSDVYYNLYNKWAALNSYKFRFSDSIMNEEERKTFYEDGFKKMIEDIYGKEHLSEGEAAVKEAVEEAVENKTITDWTEAYGYLSLLFSEFEAIISGTDECTFTCLAKLFNNHPGIHVGFRYASMVMCQGLMLANQVLAYMDWENLSDAQKTQTICSSLYTLADVSVNVGAEIYKCCSAKSPQIEAASSSGVVDAAQNTVRASEGLGQGEAEAVLSKSKQFLKDLKASAGKMSVASKIEGGILTALAFAVSVCDVVMDKEEYGSKSAVYALDIVTSIVNGMAFVATAGFALFGGVLMGMTTFAALLPGIGFVCTLVGILFSFITFLVKKFSKTLEQKYIEKYCVPFVKCLEIPVEDFIIEMVYNEKTGTYCMAEEA